MQNVFLTIYLLAILLMGCASVPDSQPPEDENEDPFTLSIDQVRGTPDYFAVCADCRAPTQKTELRKTTDRAKVPSPEKTQHAPRKLVVHFDRASSILKDSDRKALIQLVKALPKSYRLTVTGYTDDRADGGAITNQTLARQRAESVANYLHKLGVAKDHITLKAWPLCCYVASNTYESGRAKNRRAEIVFTSLSTSHYQGRIHP
jgi:outer membrane protein OmpA-like peptidoglycan-associated protein